MPLSTSAEGPTGAEAAAEGPRLPAAAELSRTGQQVHAPLRTLPRMATCGSCGGANPDGFRFCGSCGSPLPVSADAAPRARRARP